jgi:hypothetical protein
LNNILLIVAHRSSNLEGRVWKVLLMISGVIIFSSIQFLSKKIIKSNLKKKTETGSNRLVSVRFFRTKTDSNRFGSVFFRYDSFFFGWVRFGFRLIKPNQTGQFFKILIDFFSWFGFFNFFLFSRFS